MEKEMRQMGALIRERRKGLRLTQVRLAGLAGCTPLFIYEVEHGKTNPRFKNLLAVLKVLGLQIAIEEGKEGLAIKVTDAVS